MENGKKRTLITGASRGFGRAITKALVQVGHEVLGTSRNPDKLREEDRIEGVTYLPLELSEPESIRSLIDRVGEVDILINNAGISQLGSIEEINMDRIRYIFEVNLFGIVQLTKGFLPAMRRKGSGLIVNISSLAVWAALPFQSVYIASKSALEGFSRVLRKDSRKYHIRIVIVSPSHIRTSIPIVMHVDANSPYYHDVIRTREHRDQNISQAPHPDVVAGKILRIIGMKNPKAYYTIGFKPTLQAALLKLLPDRWIENLVMNMYYK